jgi:uncharacterized protein Yka (UPF0111/DUF47 family)
VNLLGQDGVFYTLLEKQADAAVRAAKAFQTMTLNFANVRDHARQIEDIEHEADDLTHELAKKLNSTFVTPLDKDDLQALSSALDDITDAIEATAVRIVLYRLTTPRPDLTPLSGYLVAVTETTLEAVCALRNLKHHEELQKTLIHIHEIENKSDDAFHQALDDLFNAPNPDALMVIKWKEIYDRIEIAVDKCEDAANIVESVVIKYA